MRPSPEIRDLVMRNLRDFAAKNVQDFLDTLSHKPGMIFIGTAPTDWIDDPAAIATVMRSAIEGGSGVMPANVRIEASQEGTVGWAAYHWTAPLPNGTTLVFRSTDIWHQEDGRWKLVHTHLSVGVPDPLIPGVALSNIAGV